MMPKFHFRLETVQQVRHRVREQRRLELLQAQQAEDQIAGQISELQAELQSLRWQARSTTGPGRLNLDELRQVQHYERSLRGELESAQNRRTTLSAEVQRRRQGLIEADREVKVLDRLQKNQQTQYRIDQARLDAKTQDDQSIAVRSLRSAS